MFSITRFGVSFGILAVAALASFGLTLLKKAPQKKKDPDPAIYVTAEAILRYDKEIDLELTGLVVPFREINMVSEVTGKVAFKSTEFESGRFVKEGTVLLRVDDIDYKLDIARLEADLAQSTSALKELDVEIEGTKSLIEIAKDDLQLQEKDYARKKNSGGGFSASEVDQLQRSVLAAATALSNQENKERLLEQSRSRLENSVKLKQSQLEQSTIQKTRCIITAPIDGVVVTENVEQDGYVQPGMQILTFEDTSKAEIRCNLRPDQLEWLWNHSIDVSTTEANRSPYRIPRVPVTITQETGQGVLKWYGILDRYDGIGVDERTKTIPCRIRVDNPIAASPIGPRALVRGMFVKLRVELPTEPLRQKNKFFAKIRTTGLLAGNTINVLRDQKVTSVPVSIVDRLEQDGRSYVIIELAGEGIQDGDKVVTSPMGSYSSDAPVKLLDSKPNPSATVDSITGDSANGDSATGDSANSDSANSDSATGGTTSQSSAAIDESKTTPTANSKLRQ